MKHKKQALISVMLTAVILILSSSPVLAADIQAAYAKMPDDLLAEFDAIPSNQKIKVMAWIEDDSTVEYEEIVKNIPEPEFAQNNEPSTYNIQSVTPTELTEEERMAQIEEMQNYIMQKRQIAQAVYLEDNTAKAAEIAENLSGGEIVYISKYSPLIIYNVTKSQAVKLAMSDCVLGLDRGNVEGEDCSANARVTIGVPAVENSGYTGQGIKLGMIESGILDESLSCFDGIEEKMIPIGNSTYTSSHASQVAAIMVGVDTGVAKGFDKFYYSNASTNSAMITNIESLLDHGVNIINSSWGIYEDCEYTMYTRWIEHIVYQHSVHFVVAAGNFGEDNVKNIGMAYNVITVGGTHDKGTPNINDDSRLNYYDGEVTCISAYNSTYTTLANKPDLCAPGGAIEIIANGNVLLYPSQHGNCGTSFAAPYVSGAIAMLCSFSPTLLNKPALVKSILCSSVSKKSTHNYDSDESGYIQYGSGIVNVSNARIIAGMYMYGNGTVAAGSSNKKTHYMGYFTAGQTVTVTLSFLKRTVFPEGEHDIIASISENQLTNVNVFICKQSQQYAADAIASSTSTRNNVEKVTFTIPETGDYVIIVQRTNDTIPFETEYGVSWQIHSNALQ